MTPLNAKTRFIATTFASLENVLSAELKELGAENLLILKRAVAFCGDKALLYKCNLCLRTGLRVLMPIHEFVASDEHKLYRGVREVNWSRYLDVRDTLAVESAVNSRYFNHTKYVALKVKDAIVDQFRDKTGVRPSVDVVDPGLKIHIHVFDDKCRLSLDTSGAPLYKRGYRLEKNEAPINEVLAAGMVLLSEWDKKSNFVDPMCGSCTILVEAALLALDMAPNMNRKSFGFMRWKDFDSALWNVVKEKAKKKNGPLECAITGCDISEKAICIGRENIARAGLTDKISLSHKPMDLFAPPAGNGTLITNPPYGERMKEPDINTLYEKIGDRLKKAYKGYDAWILSSNKEAVKHIGLRASKRISLYNGPLECKFLRYSMYEGSKKKKYNQNVPNASVPTSAD